METIKEQISIVDISGTQKNLQISTLQRIQPYSNSETQYNGRQTLPTGRVSLIVRLTTKEGEIIEVPRGVSNNDTELLDLCLALLCPPPLTKMGMR